MKAKTILTTETDGLKISSLPSRPTAPKAFGGGGLSSSQMRAAFDALPLLIIERYNNLLSDIESGELAASLVVDATDGTTLKELSKLVKNDTASLALAQEIEELKERIAYLEDKHGE